MANKYPLAKECVVCGSPFLVMTHYQAKQIYCGRKCRDLYNNVKNKEERKTHRKLKKEMAAMEEPDISLKEFIAEASERHMTYGKLSEEKELKKMKWPKHSIVNGKVVVTYE